MCELKCGQDVWNIYTAKAIRWWPSLATRPFFVGIWLSLFGLKGIYLVDLLGGGSLVGHLSKDNTSVSVLCPNRSCSVTELVAPQREPEVIFLVCLSTKFDTLFIELTCCVDMLCAPPPFWYGRHSLRRQNDPDWLWVCNLSSFIPFAGTSSFVTQWLDSYEKSSRASATVVGSESCCQQRFWGKSLQGLESRINWNPGTTTRKSLPPGSTTASHVADMGFPGTRDWTGIRGGCLACWNIH